MFTYWYVLYFYSFFNMHLIYPNKIFLCGFASEFPWWRHLFYCCLMHLQNFKTRCRILLACFWGAQHWTKAPGNNFNKHKVKEIWLSNRNKPLYHDLKKFLLTIWTIRNVFNFSQAMSTPIFNEPKKVLDNRNFCQDWVWSWNPNNLIHSQAQSPYVSTYNWTVMM